MRIDEWIIRVTVRDTVYILRMRIDGDYVNFVGISPE